MPGLLDRAFVIEFDPHVSDVLDKCKAFVHADVWTWAKQHETLLPDISVRDLAQSAVNLKMGLDWERLLRDKYLNPRSKLGAYLAVLNDSRYPSADEKQKRFEVITGLERRAYYHVQKEYRKMFPAPNMPRGRSSRKMAKQVLTGPGGKLVDPIDPAYRTSKRGQGPGGKRVD